MNLRSLFGTNTMIITMKIRPLGNRSHFDPGEQTVRDRWNWNPLGSEIDTVIVVLSGNIKYSVLSEQ